VHAASQWHAGTSVVAEFPLPDIFVIIVSRGTIAAPMGGSGRGVILLSCGD
jgi:hypothetical protein